MAIDDDDQPASPPRGPGVRTRIAVGAVGLAAVLGVGAYVITSRVVERDATAIREPGALAPMVSTGPETSPTTVAPSPSAPPSPSTSLSASSPPAAATTKATVGPEVRKRIDEARVTAAGDGHKLTRPLPPPAKVLPDSAVSTRIRKTKDDYLRITTARADLTDQKDQRMAADRGVRVGRANCTQRFHFAVNAPPKVIPNMMICWRVSAARSVVTVGVTYKGKPSASAYSGIIDREWAKLR